MARLKYQKRLADFPNLGLLPIEEQEEYIRRSNGEHFKSTSDTEQAARNIAQDAWVEYWRKINEYLYPVNGPLLKMKKSLEKAIELHGDQTIVPQANLAKFYFVTAQNKVEYLQARDEFAAVLRVDPTLAPEILDIYSKRIEGALLHDDFNRADILLDGVEQLFPENVEALYRIAKYNNKILQQQEEPPEARDVDIVRACYEDVLLRDPKHFEAMMELALVYVRANQPDSAEDLLIDALDVVPADQQTDDQRFFYDYVQTSYLHHKGNDGEAFKCAEQLRVRGADSDPGEPRSTGRFDVDFLLAKIYLRHAQIIKGQHSAAVDPEKSGRLARVWALITHVDTPHEVQKYAGFAIFYAARAYDRAGEENRPVWEIEKINGFKTEVLDFMLAHNKAPEAPAPTADI